MSRIRVGIAGAAGYTGGELLRLLLNHPHVELVYAQSRSCAGKFLHEVHHDLLGESGLQFCREFVETVDVLFLCLGHGESHSFLMKGEIPGNPRIIDLSQDFRNEQNGFVYGLCEWNHDRIRAARRVANPGCFATAIQLALLPLVKHNLLGGPVTIQATTGSTGAGQSLSETSHFSWRENNLSVYKAHSHQHLQEIHASIQRTNPSCTQPVHFIPQRGAFTRGIFCVLTVSCEFSVTDCTSAYTSAYGGAEFVRYSERAVDLKQVINTNKCHISLEKHGDQLMVVSAIDNLLKGASGQAVQNMNLMLGLPEHSGLKLKASAF